jgi:hypothetical protein
MYYYVVCLGKTGKEAGSQQLEMRAIAYWPIQNWVVEEEDWVHLKPEAGLP